MTTFNEATSSVNDVLNEYENIMNKPREVLKEKMAVLFKAFFDTHPNVKTIYWSQYTPYFNDGEECVFSVNEINYSTSEWEEIQSAWGEDDNGIIETLTWDNEQRKYIKNTEISQQLKDDIHQFSSIIQSEANEAVMLAMFDNHVWVRAHRDGFEIEEFSHH